MRSIHFLVGLLVVVFLLGFEGMLTVEAQRPDAPTYGERGEFAVGTREYTLEDDARALTVTVWYPASVNTDAEAVTSYNLHLFLNVQGRAVRDADFAEGLFPLVVFSHGSGGSRVLSLWLTEHLASHGFIVVASDHPQNNVTATLNAQQDFAVSYALRPFDVLRLIDWARDESYFSDLVDGERVGVAGHSFGGYTALSVGGTRLDIDSLKAWCEANISNEATRPLTVTVCFLQSLARDIAEHRGYDDVPTGAWDATTIDGVRAVVALAPWNAPIMNHDEHHTPTLIIAGDSDRITPFERDALVMYEAMVQARRWLITFSFADHYIFVDSCPPSLVAFGAFGSCSDAVWDMQRAQDLSNHYIVGFLRYYLYDDEAGLAIFDERLPRGLSLETAEAE